MGKIRKTIWPSIALLVLGATGLAGCEAKSPPAAQGEVRIGVLLVANGSKSSTWVGMIRDLAEAVKEPVLAEPGIKAVRLAFIEEASPGIASEMKAFDADNIDEVIVVPLFIAQESTRMNVHLQFLTGMRSEAKTIKQLQNEGFEIYYPRARVAMTPALNQSEVLKKNVLRRIEALRGDDSGEDMAVLLVGYGDQVFGQQMEEMMEGIGRYLKIKTEIDTVAYAFCGNLTDYSGAPVVEAINEVLELEREVLVVPVLLGVDEMMQRNTIQAAVNAVETSSKVRYEQDAVLPDARVNEWVLEKVREAAQRIQDAGGKTVPAPTRFCEPDC
ncbi:MAG: CbiX/SirB N-terminal domain-containing protein [Gammaproteobacteria bacterium]|nr:CbiX/SirB N-terminal domain-containing protein [Gammaproteobacteria bacterium]